jgi:hypothetical protein
VREIVGRWLSILRPITVGPLCFGTRRYKPTVLVGFDFGEKAETRGGACGGWRLGG